MRLCRKRSVAMHNGNSIGVKRQPRIMCHCFSHQREQKWLQLQLKACLEASTFLHLHAYSWGCITEISQLRIQSYLFGNIVISVWNPLRSLTLSKSNIGFRFRSFCNIALKAHCCGICYQQATQFDYIFTYFKMYAQLRAYLRIIHPNMIILSFNGFLSIQ